MPDVDRAAAARLWPPLLDFVRAILLCLSAMAVMIIALILREEPLAG